MRDNSLLSNAPLFYPSAREWMFDYCIYLGPYTSPEGHDYDLGIYLHPSGEISAAIVYGDEPGDYISGDLTTITPLKSGCPYYAETIKRARACGLMPEE
jgi:hypothetical protein